MAVRRRATRLTFIAVYTPPNVAKHGCHVFDSSTGEKKHVPKCGYYSAFGQVMTKDENASCVSAAKAA